MSEVPGKHHSHCCFLLISTIVSLPSNQRYLSAPELSRYRQVPPRRPEARHVYYMYMMLAEDRDELLSDMINRGIEAKIHYPIPMHIQKATVAQDPPFGRTDFSRTKLNVRP